MANVNKPEISEAENAPPASNVVGGLLRRAREARGLEIAAVSSELRIQKRFLQAIEEGRLDVLPGQTYASGFVRAYADFLKLDPAEISERFHQEYADFGKTPELVFRAPVNESSAPGGRILLIAVMLGAAAYGVWHYAHSGFPFPWDGGSTVTERIATLFSPPPPQDQPEPFSPPSLGAPDEPPPAAVAEEPSPAVSVAASEETGGDGSEPLPEETAQTASVPAAPRDDGSTAVETVRSSEPVLAPSGGEPVNASSRVMLRADQDCWIELRGPQGRMIYAGLLRKGESYAVSERQGQVLTAGNAGALKITVDGRSLPPLGGLGMVRRDVSMDPEALIASLGNGD